MIYQRPAQNFYGGLLVFNRFGIKLVNSMDNETVYIMV